MSRRPGKDDALQGHTARKRFGQNFLHDANVIANIAKVIHAQPGEALVEIGPGLGALTAPLVAAAGFLDVIEIDRDLAPRIAARFGEKVCVHESDALRYDFAQLAGERGKKLRVVGNLPYNISTPLIFHLLDAAAHINDMHFMLQKEVVDRMGAAAGEDDYGRLSVLLQYRCRVEPLFTVPPGAFNPQPKVHSAIVRLVPQAPAVRARDETMLARVVTQAFSQRRKTLRNAVKGLVDDAGIVACGLDPQVRCEMLTVAQFVALADYAAAAPAGNSEAAATTQHNLLPDIAPAKSQPE